MRAACEIGPAREPRRTDPSRSASGGTAGLRACGSATAGLHAADTVVRTAAVPVVHCASGPRRSRGRCPGCGVLPRHGRPAARAPAPHRVRGPGGPRRHARLVRRRSVAEAAWPSRPARRREVVDVCGAAGGRGPSTPGVDLGEVAGRAVSRVDDLVVVGDDVATRLDTGRRSRWSPGTHRRPARRRCRPGAALDGRTTAPGALLGSCPLVRVGSRSPMETRARLMFRAGRVPRARGQRRRLRRPRRVAARGRPRVAAAAGHRRVPGGGPRARSGGVAPTPRAVMAAEAEGWPHPRDLLPRTSPGRPSPGLPDPFRAGTPLDLAGLAFLSRIEVPRHADRRPVRQRVAGRRRPRPAVGPARTVHGQVCRRSS